MKQIKKILRLFIITLLLSACSIPINQNSANESELPYLSITMTTQEENGELLIHFLTYDIASKEIKEAAQVPMTAQYSLGVIDKRHNSLYFAERDTSGSDQLVKIDLKNNNKEKLTKSLYAINYIIPSNNKIIVAAQKHETRNVELVTYEPDAKKLILWDKNDHDTCVQSLTFNPHSKKLYASLFSFQESLDKIQQYEQEQAEHLKPPVFRIVEYSTDGKQLRTLLTIEEYVMTFAVSEDETKAVLRSAPMVFSPRQVYLIDLETGERQPLTIKNYDAFEHIYFSPDNKGLYLTAIAKANIEEEGGVPNGLYYYDFETKQMERIFAQPNGYVNNFMLLN